MYEHLLQAYLSQNPLQDRTTAITHFNQYYAPYFTWESVHPSLRTKMKYAATKPTKAKRAYIAPVATENVVNHPFIEINRYRVSILAVDCDNAPLQQGYSVGFDPQTYLQHGLPLPNTVVQTARGYQAMWFLKYPISKKTGHASMQYYTDVRSRIIAALDCDMHCNISGAMRNPFYMGFEHDSVIFHRAAHELCDLDVVPNVPRSGLYSAVEYESGARNCATFRYALALFKQHNEKMNLSGLFLRVSAWVKSQACASALDAAEIKTICSSVIRNGHRYKVRADRNYGAMQLPVFDYSGLTADQRVAVIKHRQGLGGRYAAQVKQARKYNQLQKYMKRLVAIHDRVPKKSQLARVTKSSINTISKHWDALLESVSQLLSKQLTGTSGAAVASIPLANMGSRARQNSLQSVHERIESVKKIIKRKFLHFDVGKNL